MPRTATTTVDRTPGTYTLPGAKGFLPPGTSQADCILHNRVLKATVTALMAHLAGHDPETITETEMDACAQKAGVLAPGSGVTRAMIRELMRSYTTVGTDPHTGPDTKSFGYWQISYRDDLDRAMQTAILVTPREVLMKLEHLRSARSHPYTHIEVNHTTVLTTSKVIDPTTLQ
jgi:hypothetical protein